MDFVQHTPSTWGQFVRSVAANLQPVLTLLGMLLEPREVIELRVSEQPNRQRPPHLIANGYFSDPMELAEAVLRYEQQPVLLAFAVNPVRHTLLLAASNTLRRPAAWTSVDTDVTRRAVLPIKFQLAPEYEAESADEAYHLLWQYVLDCQAFLTRHFGWPKPAIVYSYASAELVYASICPIHLLAKGWCEPCSGGSTVGIAIASLVSTSMLRKSCTPTRCLG